MLSGPEHPGLLLLPVRVVGWMTDTARGLIHAFIS
jgi:hypothetical protein